MRRQEILPPWIWFGSGVFVGYDLERLDFERAYTMLVVSIVVAAMWLAFYWRNS